MANGTIAFDTLSTSGQISGTAKSVDTDFLVSATAKVVGGYNQEGSEKLGIAADGSSRFSLNIASYTDAATSIVTGTFTSAFSDLEYITTGCSRGDACQLNVETGTAGNNTTLKRDTRTYASDSESDRVHYFTHIGDLA